MKKIGILALVLVFALGSLGIGYAHWSQTLYINGTVKTGTLCWGFQEGSLRPLFDNHISPPDQHESTWDWTCPVGIGPPAQKDKNVGWIELALEGEKGEHDGYKLYGTAKVTLKNVYPCYFTEISVVVANGGTIPIIVDQVLINGTEVEMGELYYNEHMELEWLNGPPMVIQLDPCNDKELSFKIHIIEEGDYPDIEGAQPGETYTFTIELVGTQWNLVD